jgi:hypothetical protein
METMCDRLGGAWLYMLYRHLSSGVHAPGSMSLHIAEGDG